MLLDPRILANELDNLMEAFFTWSIAAREMVHEAQITQRQITERINRVIYRAHIKQTEREADQESAHHIEHELSALLLTCASTKIAATQIQECVQQASTSTHTNLHYCHKQLQAAQIMLKQAQHKLHQAEEAYSTIQAKLKATLRSMQEAEQALSVCKNQSSKESSRRCVAEDAAVRTMKARMAAVETEMQQAKHAVHTAEADVKQGNMRVAACTRAVTYAQQAVELAQLAETNAQQAINAAGQSMEHGETAQKAFVEASSALVDEEEAVQNLLVHISLIETSIGEAALHLKNAEHFEASVQRYASLVCQEIRARLEALLDFNRKSL